MVRKVHIGEGYGSSLSDLDLAHRRISPMAIRSGKNRGEVVGVDMGGSLLMRCVKYDNDIGTCEEGVCEEKAR